MRTITTEKELDELPDGAVVIHVGDDWVFAQVCEKWGGGRLAWRSPGSIRPTTPELPVEVLWPLVEDNNLIVERVGDEVRTFGPWFDWFAWYPVWTTDRGYCWLRTVKKRIFLIEDRFSGMNWRFKEHLVG